MCGVRWPGISVLVLMCLAEIASARADDTLNMQANIVQTACTISFVDDGGGAVAGAMTLPDAASDGMVSTNNQCGDGKCIFPPTTQVSLRLNDCGVGGGNVPSVSLTGVTATQADVLGTPSANLKYAFRNSGSGGGTSKEFFVVAAKNSAPQFSSAGLFVGDGNDLIPLKVGGVAVKTGDSGEGAVSDPIYLTVSCGYGCQSAQARAGSVSASLQFSFTYR
ncbi:type 1 fimbrial protein [Citrobacter koseri]|uniref:type 1 fimbrial protein n=1 Tax=Citrobacter koseri TaxID=545 RepID=UPI001158C014|nr:type 1 fimbrial protein [Citrobacter koseri]